MTPDARPAIWQLADELQMDLRAAQAKLVELRAQLAALNLPDPTRHECPACGVLFNRRAMLDEHLYHTHDGPEPPHWLEAERIAAPDPDTDDLGRLEHRGKAAGANGLTAPRSGDEA